MAYATLDEVKEFLGIQDSNLQNDSNLGRALDAASKYIEDKTGRTFDLDQSATARIYTPSAYSEELVTHDIGSTSGLIVELGDITHNSWAAVDTSTYEAYPANAIALGRPVTGFTSPSGWGRSCYSRVRVTAQWGWPSVPAEVVQATILQASRIWKRKDSPGGVYGSAEWGLIRVTRNDPDVLALIAGLTVPGFGG